jgi:hypothetical protein
MEPPAEATHRRPRRAGETAGESNAPLTLLVNSGKVKLFFIFYQSQRSLGPFVEEIPRTERGVPRGLSADRFVCSSSHLLRARRDFLWLV